jgi:hypothetical protein
MLYLDTDLLYPSIVLHEPSLEGFVLNMER